MKQFLILLLASISLTVFSQQKMQINLQDAIRLAQSQSLQAFLLKNNYLAEYWNYRSFKADYLPSLFLNSDLLSYSNANKLRYNSITQTDEFVRTETLGSQAALSLQQNVGATGGTFFVQSSLNRQENFGDKGFVQYSSAPVSIGYRQELFGYNKFKWERQLKPREYEKAKKEYLHQLEEMNQLTTRYFFDFARARMSYDIASYNYTSTDTLLQVARKRFNLGTVQRDELLKLELSLNNASIAVEEATLNLRKSKDALVSFLRLPLGVEPELQLPEIRLFKVPEQKAMDLAMERNAEMIRQQINLLQAESDVVRTKAENRFQANLNVSYGINKADGYYDYENNKPVNGQIDNVFKPDFDHYQQLNVGVGIPILDWGKRRGQYKMAKSRQEATRLSVEQAIERFQQEVVTKAMEFNIQQSRVNSAGRADELAMDSYELTKVRFQKGNASVLELNDSQERKDNARVQFIQSLSNFWMSYYEIRRITLYDFETDTSLEAGLEVLLEEMIK